MVDQCYSDLGCFPLSEEFYHPRHRPFNTRPWPRKRINTRFEFYSSLRPEGFQLLPWDEANLRHSTFDPKLETKIIIPGWLDNIKRALWVRRMKDALLWHWHPVNIIVVQWRNFTPYTVAAANTRVVGAELANLLRWIEQHFRYSRGHHHLIGHSLGAHIAGYCGDRLPGLGRITALDPARPFFQHMPKSVRLDRADAKFVDAIHSDFTPENAIFLLMSFGMTTPVGHLDFYPNGPPLLQPGCLRDSLMSVRNGIQRGLEHASLSVAFLESVRYLTACDHQRSHEWFTESILNRKCIFVGVRCNQFEGMINGRCTCDDSASACAIMGIHADQMYLNHLHEDLWPQTGAPRPSARPRPPTASKDQIYAQYKQQASQLRQPPITTLPDDLDELLAGLQEIQDNNFVEYLRSEIFRESQPLPLSRPDLREREEDLNEIDSHDLNLGRDLLARRSHNDHFREPLSDLDRDIENWYEDTSRWYLRTGKRPNYCLNQYQVLVYIGALSARSGQDQLRANLIISIVGSRGQLINQRFVPRTKKLDPFTMQPFFILLEGSYSLGNILSVAVAWEARRDPDPVQATVSFQSNLLEGVQSFWPSYSARHPLFAETLALDRTKQYQANEIRRSDWPDEDCSSEDEANPGQCSLTTPEEESDINLMLEDAKPSEQAIIDLLAGEEPLVSAESGQSGTIEHNDLLMISDGELVHESVIAGVGGPNQVTASLHNIGIHLDGAPLDSIVVSEVRISPIQANYGKDESRLARVFCPARTGLRLRRDQTAKLVPSLTGRCRWQMSPI